MATARTVRPAEPARRRMPGRPRAARVLVVAGAVLLLLAVLLGYAWRAAFDSDQFAARASAALRTEPVSALAAEKLTDQVVLGAAPDVLAARPLIQSVAESIVGGGAFGALFRTAAADVHRSVFDRDASTVTVSVGNAVVVLRAALAKVDPAVARRLPARRPVELLQRELGPAGADVVRTAGELRAAAIGLAVLGLLGLAGGALLAPDRRAAVVHAGAAVAAAAVVALLVYWTARAVAVGRLADPQARAAAGAVWDAFLKDLRTVLLLLAGLGAVLAAAASSLIHPVDIDRPLLRLGRAVAREPGRLAWRWARAAGLLAAGLVTVLEPEVVLRVVATVAGAYLVYQGVDALLRLIAPPRETRAAPPAAAEPEPVLAGAPGPGRMDPVALRRVAAGAVAGALALGGVAVFAASGAATAPEPPLRACNGHASLCGKRLDEVVLPATHNSMSVPLEGWFSAEQERDVGGQLADGIRGLLVDTHYGIRLDNGRVRTDLEDPGNPGRNDYVDGLGEDAVDAALELRSSLGFRGDGERGMYACHSFCELGFTPIGVLLGQLRDFLATHPHEVVVLINQDAVAPEDFAEAMGDAGLLDFVYRGPVDRPWPTLREMIETGGRLVVFAERDAGDVPWYHVGYRAALQETPYTFKRVRDLTDPATIDATCGPNRGPASAPLLLINHWISTDPAPRPSQASVVNAYAPLLRRARACRRIRDRVPTLLAVNFYRRGDVFRVADTLNGVGGS